MSIYDYDEEKTRKTLFEEAKEMCRDEVKAEVRKELEGEVKAEVRKELEGEVKAEIRAEIIDEVKLQNTISLIVKKVRKNKPLSTIASELEKDVAEIEPIYKAVTEAAPDYDEETIVKNMHD